MIYLIKSGSYSAVATHGYFTNADDAYAYCALVNKKQIRADDWYSGNYYVEPCDEISVEFPKERPKFIYEYRFFFRRKSEVIGRWRFIEPYSKEPRDVYPQSEDHNPRISHYRRAGVLETEETITVYADFCNYDRAKKAAQDYFAFLLAEGKITD